MKKTDLKTIFGSYTKAAQAMSITKGAITFWPDELKQSHIDRVIGAALRMGVCPPEFVKSQGSDADSDTNKEE